MEVTRHFTATTFIVTGDKVLLHLHKKLGFWLPVGGHIDRDELPHVAALREAKEESGLDVTLYDPDVKLGLNDTEQLLRPAHIILQDINEFHQHIDFAYYATSDKTELIPEDGDYKNIKWLTADEIKKLDAPDNVKVLSLEALKLLGGL